MEIQERRSIGKWISILHRHFQIYINNELKSYDLNSSEYIYLVNIAKHEGENQKYLSNMLAIDNALTTRVMKGLEKKNYIIREKSSADKRSYIVKLTEKGHNVQPMIIEKLYHWTDILSRDMNEEEIESIIAKLKLMSQNVLLVTKWKKKEWN